MSIERVIELARADLGYTESPPNSNNTKFGAAYGLQGQPWCLIFLWWLFREAGESAAFFGGAKTASCGTLLRWYREQGQTVPVSEVQPGDIVILNFHGTKDMEHCGLVVDVPASGAYVETIEGNTSPGREGSQDNGGCVALKTRLPSQIVAVCRPEYKETPPPAAPEPPQEGATPPAPLGQPPQEGATPPAPSGQPPQEGAKGDGPSSGPSDHLPPGEGKETGDDITGHWAEKAIRWCVETGLMQGYEDGTFQPDKGVTRAELATVMRRFFETDGE